MSFGSQIRLLHTQQERLMGVPQHLHQLGPATKKIGSSYFTTPILLSVFITPISFDSNTSMYCTSCIYTVHETDVCKRICRFNFQSFIRLNNRSLEFQRDSLQSRVVESVVVHGANRQNLFIRYMNLIYNSDWMILELYDDIRAGWPNVI